ncbi:MAG: BamA/TamA family outer membrane protein [Candidatus Eisenbacteria bacterium]|nr:BamA/TamA family outer membrane protein [Candidatus Eisenbacteria bacterium]
MDRAASYRRDLTAGGRRVPTTMRRHAPRASDGTARWAGVLVAALLLMLLPVGARPEVRLDLSGDRSLGRAAVEEAFGGLLSLEEPPAEPGGLLESGVDSLLTLYIRAGRPFARIEAELGGPSGEGVLTVRVDEGPEPVLAGVRLRGVGSLPEDELLRAVRLEPGEPVSADVIAAAAAALVEVSAERGRPLALVRPELARATPDGRFDLTFHVDEGPPVVFGTPVVVGNETTRDVVVLRELGIEPGEPFSRSDLELARSRLERTGLFSEVARPAVAYIRGLSKAVPVFEVEEASVNRVLGALGYVPGDDRLSGAVEVVLGNIAGTGRRAEVAWERLPSDERRASFLYVEPWVLGAPIDVSVSGSQTVRDTISTVTGGDLRVTARMGERSRVSWSLGAERYVPGESGPSPTRGVRTALSAVFDGTDSPLNPTRGLSAAATIEYAAKEIDDTGGRERSGTAEFVVRAYLPVAFDQTVALRASGAGIWSSEEDVPYHEEVPLGGAKTLRGYREEQFRGVRVVSGSVEYRYLIGRSSRVLAFVDAGRYRGDGPNPATDTKLGYGIGLRGSTGLGIIAVDYGLGEGDSLLDGKLHVGFTRTF